MATVRLPPAIQRQKDEIARLEAESAAGSGDQTATTEQVVTTPAEPPAAATPPAPAAGQDDLRASINAMQATLSRLEADNQSLRAENQRLAQDLTTAQAAIPASPPEWSGRAHEVLGEDATNVITDIVNAEVSKRVSAVEQQIAPVIQRESMTESQFQQAVRAKLGRTDWQFLQSQPEFQGYMAAPGADGVPKGERLQEAIRTRDVASTVRAYAEFAQSIGIPITVEAPPKADVTTVVGVPLEQREGPSGSSSAPIQIANGAGVITRESVQKFYRDWQRAKIDRATYTAKADAEWKAKEREIIAANQAGRIVG